MSRNLITGYYIDEGQSNSSPFENDYIIDTNRNIGNNISTDDLNELIWEFE